MEHPPFGKTARLRHRHQLEDRERRRRATPIDVPANDQNTDDGPLKVDSVDDSSSNGTVAITNSGADLTYVPDADYCNTSGSDPDDTFTYTLNGGSGGDGDDEVSGGDGDDLIRGGKGNDKVSADEEDEVAKNCETVR